MKAGSIIYCLLGGLLVAGIALVAWSSNERNKEMKLIFSRDIAVYDRFSESILGLGGIATPLGDTESVLDAVEQVLRFDRGGYWRMTTTEGDVWIYLAYWGPGKQSIREIAFHTPDHCWVNAGWKKQALPPSNMIAQEDAFKTAKQRCFSAGTSSLSYVAFWHVFDSQVIDYGNRAVPSDWSLLTSLWRVGLGQRKAQWFIRVHSDRPLNQLADSKPINAVTQLIDQIAPGGRVLSLE